MMLLVGNGVWGQIYVNTFTGASACPTNGNVPTMALNSTGTPVTRSTVTCTATLNVFNSSTLNNTAAIVNTSYIEFSATAGVGFQLNLTSVSFFRQGSNTAPNQVEVRYSTDGFTSSTTWGAAPLTPTVGSVTTWDFADFSTASGGTVTFRIYPYGTQRCDLTVPAASAAGTFRVDDVTINGTVAVSGGPTINVTPGVLSGFIALSGVNSAQQTYSVDGSLLTNNIIITPPTGFLTSIVNGGPYSSSTITLTQSGGVVASTPIYVVMNSATLGTNTGNITHTSAGSNNPNVSLTGNVITTEPSVQGVITIPVPSITAFSMVVNFTSGDGAKRILVARSGSAVNSNPVDGTTYTANAVFGSGTQIGVGNYAVYAGAGNTVTVSGLSPSTTYHFAVYEYNDAGIAGAENYLITTPGTGNATTLSTDGDYRTIATGNWSNLLNWQTRVAGLWVVASSLPVSTSNVYIQAAHTITIDVAIATCNDLHINSAASSVLAIGTNSIEVNGKLRAFTGTAVTSLGADVAFYSGQTSTTTVGSTCITSSGVGRMRIIGNTRVVTYTGEWGNNPPSWDVEFAPTAGQTLTIQTGFKAGNITIATGTVLSTSTDMRMDGGAAGTGSLAVKNGATLQYSNNSITLQRVGTASATSHFASVTVEATGILEFSGTSSPVIGASAFALNGTVIYSGAGNQTLAAKGGNSAATDPNAYTHITISGGGNKTLPIAITATGTLNLISGYVITTTPNLLTMTAGSSVAGASNTSYVSGPVKKAGNTAFTFPVGKTGTGYVPIGVNAFAGTLDPVNDAFTAEYVRSSAAAMAGGVTALGINHVSSCDYWQLDRASGTPTVDVVATWSSNNQCNGTPYIDDLLKLVLVHHNGASWNSSDLGIGANTGTIAAGTRTWPLVTTFSPFSFGSTTYGSNPLPILVNYLNGYKKPGKHLLNWKITCLGTPRVTMSLERSLDGRNYSSIYSITADALRCAQPFGYTDALPLAGLNYYRLKMTDADGQITYSGIVALLNAVKGFEIINVVPNPVTSTGLFKLNIASAQVTKMNLVITDMLGREVNRQTVSLIAGYNPIDMNVAGLAPGNYNISGITAGEKTGVIRFVKQ